MLFLPSCTVQLGATASSSEFAVTQLASKSQVERTSCAGGGASQREGRDRSATLKTGDVEKEEERKKKDGHWDLASPVRYVRARCPLPVSLGGTACRAAWTACGTSSRGSRSCDTGVPAG